MKKEQIERINSDKIIDGYGRSRFKNLPIFKKGLITEIIVKCPRKCQSNLPYKVAYFHLKEGNCLKKQKDVDVNSNNYYEVMASLDWIKE